MQIINQPLVSPTVSDTPTNHIIVVDCSVSMYSELPKIRSHLKNKIPTMVKYGDTLSVIWFSGRDQFGVLFEGVEVHGLLDLTQINSTIDASSPAEWTELMRDFRLSDYAELEWLGITSELNLS